MRRVDGLDSLPVSLPWPVVSVGTFDGVHLGHRAVLDEVVRWAREQSGTAVVVTFAEPPKTVLASGQSGPLITSVPHRLRLLAEGGVDLTVVLEFTPALAAMSAGDFSRRVLVQGLGARGVVLGHDSAFGRGREGTEEFLRAHRTEFGLDVRGVDATLVDGAPVSSTRVRQAVLKGDFALSERLLGRRFSVFGAVIRGSGRGRRLGFPTANLQLLHEVAPPDGVYVVDAVIDSRARPAVASVGTSPTFPRTPEGEDAERIVETHVLDFEGSLYGHELEVFFVRRLRDQQRFATPEALASAIRRDVDATRDFFAGR